MNAAQLSQLVSGAVSLDEAATRVQLIDPALHARGWTEDLIRREKTPGGADIVDGRPVRRRGRVDYLLCVPAATGQAPLPVAVLEAKAQSKPPALGLQQGREYGRRFNVPFSFSTNGHLFTEFGSDTRKIIDNVTLPTFPSPADLRTRYEAYKGIDLDSPEAAPLLVPYRGGDASRYYFQDAAIRAALEKMARDTEGARILLSLATGTGKTVIAAYLLHKLAKAGQLRRALFICDRDELRTQAISRLQGLFGGDAQIVTTTDPQKNARILVASYQTLNVADEDDDPRFWKDNYPEGYFSHIIIDEAHRSAWGKWSVILRDNPDAVHIGLTATPREFTTGARGSAHAADEKITAHNVKYFGAPVYEYSLGDGQEDGYLSACEVIRRRVDLDKDVLTREDIETRTATDPYTGEIINPADIEPAYPPQTFEAKLMLPDRVQAMCEDLFQLMLDSGGVHQKTIVFCARDAHATQVQITMNNIYEQWCAHHGHNPRDWYAFQCTGNPDLRPPAKELIADFKGSRSTHFIATTVDLLSTGVDIPNLANVVFFRYLESPISFYQMVGRGSRTGEPRGSKPMFRLFDYTDATRLFGEPFKSKPAPVSPAVGPGGAPDGRPKMIRVAGFSVQVEGDGRSILVQRDGTEVLVPVEEYKLQLALRLEEQAPELDALRDKWVVPQSRRALMAALPGGEPAVRLIRRLEDQDECDLYDVLAELTFGVPARSRAERAAAFPYKSKSWLRQLPDATAAALTALAHQFERGGIEELEAETVFDAAEVSEAGGLRALLDGGGQPAELLDITKRKLLAA